MIPLNGKKLPSQCGPQTGNHYFLSLTRTLTHHVFFNIKARKM